MTVSPLKIAVVAPPWFPVPPTGYGGIESVCAGLVDGLVEMGHDVTLIGAGEDATDATRFFAATREPQGDLVGDALTEVRHAAAVSQVLGDLDIDVIHDHTVAGPLVAAGLEIPIVVTAHGPVDGGLGDYYGDLSRYYGDLGERIAFVSISNSQRAGAVDLPWAATVYNGVRVSDHDFRRDKDEFVLFIGRCCPDKAPELAVHAARDSGRRLIALTKCREPDEKQHFEQVVEPLLGSDVDWLEEPPKERKHELLARARALVMPIQWDEPFGMVMIEALASGTPVVALRRGAVPEIVDDGVNGFICDEPGELPAAIERASEIDPDRCRAVVEDRFTLQTMARGYEEVYRGVIERSRAGILMGAGSSEARAE
ncbi:MAG TPA: glycosyltransferase family 4 protein [Jiangellaceae bacterium]|jgi:glycosyltransferase involved in cell wall biosynthesis|nr:glycosyltransferase family 4 protein [Jiangellaceae bacterium]